MFLIFLALASNTSAESLENIENEIFLMNCPLPTFSVLPTLTNITGFAVNYDVDYNATAHANKVVVFECTIDDITGNFGANTVIYEPTEGFFILFDNAFAWVGYVYSSITAFFQKVSHLFTLISFFVAPTNFNILGYTLADIGGIALAFVISVYAICYIAIGIMAYKVTSPFSGGS